MPIQYRNGKLTAHFTPEMLSDGITEYQTFKVFLGSMPPDPPTCQVAMPLEQCYECLCYEIVPASGNCVKNTNTIELFWAWLYSMYHTKAASVSVYS